MKKPNRQDLDEIMKQVNRFLEKGETPIVRIPKSQYPSLRKRLGKLNYEPSGEDAQYIDLVVGIKSYKK